MSQQAVTRVVRLGMIARYSRVAQRWLMYRLPVSAKRAELLPAASQLAL
jgi:hypothetical protein